MTIQISSGDQPRAPADGCGFADLLKARTRALHDQAERSGFVRDIVTGDAGRHGYAVYLRNLLPAYQELEAGLERNRQLPGLGSIAWPELYRAPALRSDLMALQGASWERTLPLLPLAERYRRRIARVADSAPGHLVAHAYVRYLGDLNGGAILCRRLAGSLGLDASALSFFRFPSVEDLPAAARKYRAALDAAGEEIRSVPSVLREAVLAFRFNIAVSEAVHDYLE